MKTIFKKSFGIIIIFLCAMISPGTSQDDNWTHYRGNNLDGISTVDNVPVRWKADSNIVWKTGIHGRGWSSPVVFNDRIWLTTATDDGGEMFAVCLDFETGEVLMDINVFAPDSIYRKHAINSYATPTPCIEKDFVYVHFGRYGTTCLNTKDGSTVWKRTDLECEHIQGPGSSPFLYKNLLILHMEGSDVQYIVALDKSNGKTVWRIERPKDVYDRLEPIGKKAYITPLIVKVDGRDQLISNGAAVCIAYEPETGKEIWRVIRGVDSTIAMPFSEDGIVYFYTGFTVPDQGSKFANLMAVDPGGHGDVALTNIIWSIETPVLQLLTPVIKDGLIYTIDSKSKMMCIDAKTGQSIWTERVKGKYNSSPVYASGHLYFSSTRGEVIVIKEGRRFEIAAINDLENEIWATPAILRNSLLIRTSKHLYKIGK